MRWSILTASAVIALSSASLGFAQAAPPLDPIPAPSPAPPPSDHPPPLPDPIPVKLTVSGNEAQGSFEFEGTGIGADLTIAFESAVGLTPAALDVTPARPQRPAVPAQGPEGAPFRDITRWEGRGSYRDDGSGGDFSEFLIVVDLRPIDMVIAGKFDDLQAAAHALPVGRDPAGHR